MIGEYVKRMFGKGKHEDQNKFKISLDDTVEVSTVDLFASLPDMSKKFVLPTGHLSIHEVGVIEMDNGKAIRLYCTDETRKNTFMVMLAIGKLANGKEVVDEAMLFTSVETRQPRKTEEWNDVVKQMTDSQTHFEGLTYESVWGALDEPSDVIDHLVTYEEVRTNREGSSHWITRGTLFCRDTLEEGGEELLLVEIEEFADDDLGAVYGLNTFIGVDISPAMIKINHTIF